jgi:folylpolyglutamate synthase/dihydropteroate synthase
MRALVDSLKEERDFPVRAAICGFCGDKDVSANLALLREVADSGIAVAIRNPRSLTSGATAKLMRKAGFSSVGECKTLEEALSCAPDGTVVCGSLFLAGEALVELGAYPWGETRFDRSESLKPF